MAITSNEDMLRKALGLGNSAGLKKSRSIKTTKIKDTELIPDSGTRIIEFENIQGKKRRPIKPIDELVGWTGYDFAIYIADLYQERCSDFWNIKPIATQRYISQIKESLIDVFGFCDNIMFKDFVDFFFSVYFDAYKLKRGDFYPSWIMEERPLTHFESMYDYRQSVRAYHGGCKVKESTEGNNDKDTITNRDIEISFLTSDKLFLSTYGIVLTINWLIMRRNFSVSEAKMHVCNTGGVIRREDNIGVIKSATEKFSPYPEWMPFKDIDSVSAKISTSLFIDITFQQLEHNKFDFLKERK